MSRRASSIVAAVLSGWLIPLCCSCFSEQSFPMRPEALCSVKLPCAEGQGCPPPARQWGEVVHRQIEHLLPRRSQGGVTSVGLRQRDGRPIDLGRKYGFDPAEVDGLLQNLDGIIQTAQVIPVEEPRGRFADGWRACRRVEIPMSDGLVLSALLGEPTGKPIDGSFVILGHGLFGRQYGCDQRNTFAALQAFGHHVLAIEMRGHGMTEAENPRHPMTFGIDEPRDLLAIDRWLRRTQGATRVGMIAYSLTAHQALMAAWIDSDPNARQECDSPIFRSLPQSSTDEPPAFDGGMLLFSPAINLVEYCNSLDEPCDMISSPVRAAFQDRAATRLRERGQKPRRCLWAYAEYELRRSRWAEQYPDYPSLLRDVLVLIDFTGSSWRRLEHVRIPIVVMQAADDPVVGSAQAAVNLFAPLDNPNCCLIVTRDGGHSGFSATSASYQYSLIRAFFDPATAPRIASEQQYELVGKTRLATARRAERTQSSVPPAATENRPAAAELALP
jgi:predicted alpha/beta-fold hydrolase